MITSYGDTGGSCSARMVPTMINTDDTPHAFFQRYAAALLARDEKAVAAMYAVRR